MAKRKIKYEPHPVSPERKAELRAAGYTILDARFRPADEKPAAPPEPTPGLTRTQVARMSKADLQRECEARGIAWTGTADDARAALAEAVFG